MLTRVLKHRFGLVAISLLAVHRATDQSLEDQLSSSVQGVLK